jgi:hypothetical protein
MKDALKIGGVVFILIGLSLFSPFGGADPSVATGNAKGAFATVASSGGFWVFGMILLGIGVLCFFVQSFMKE